MADLKSPFLIKLKGWFFLCIGVSASALLLVEAPSLQVALLLGLAVWGFCRFYYFMFYVIERYVDSRYRFTGLLSFAKYFLKLQGWKARNSR
jgi:hypothetical protein